MPYDQIQLKDLQYPAPDTVEEDSIHARLIQLIETEQDFASLPASQTQERYPAILMDEYRALILKKFRHELTEEDASRLQALDTPRRIELERRLAEVRKRLEPPGYSRPHKGDAPAKLTP